MPASDPSTDYALDAAAVRRVFDKASLTFDDASAVHTEIRRRLLERLDVVRIEPNCILDLGAGTGHATRDLKRRYRGAQVVAADLSPGMLRVAGTRARFFQRFGRIAADARRLPLQDGSIDLIFSNLMLQWIADPDTVMVEVRRVMKAQGLFTFTSLGPDSLRELRAAWGSVDSQSHVQTFFDMHDIGDALLRAGFIEPVMDTERLTVTYRDWPALRHELKATGSTHIGPLRRRGLTGRAAATQAVQTFEQTRTEGVLPVTLEVVYGHAWAGLPRKRATKEYSIPVGQIARSPHR